jgi:hypothetical protein
MHGTDKMNRSIDLQHEGMRRGGKGEREEKKMKR